MDTNPIRVACWENACLRSYIGLLPNGGSLRVLLGLKLFDMQIVNGTTRYQRGGRWRRLARGPVTLFPGFKNDECTTLCKYRYRYQASVSSIDIGILFRYCVSVSSIGIRYRSQVPVSGLGIRYRSQILILSTFGIRHRYRVPASVSGSGSDSDIETENEIELLQN